MDTQMMVWTVGGVTVGIVAVAHWMRRVRFNEDLAPVSDQWLAEQRGRSDL